MVETGERHDARDEAAEAARLLFGDDVPEGAEGPAWREVLRDAFRRRALEAHPDRAQVLGRGPGELAADFHRLVDAYHLLSRLSGPPRLPAAPPRQSRPHRPPRDHLSGCAMPRRPLMLAEYLYYSGRVSWRNMVEAVSWQRRQRPAIGRIAVEWGHLSDGDVREILEHRRREGAANEPFGEFARRKGYLSSAQLLALLGRQRRLQRRIGQYFVESGLLADREILSAEDDLGRHNARWRRAG